MYPGARVYVAGSQTLVGSAIVRHLTRQRRYTLIRDPEPDLLRADAVQSFFERHRPEFVFLAAGRSGGILENQRHPVQLLRDNLLIASHVIHSAFLVGTTKLLYLGSSCTYPRGCAQPMRPEYLLSGPWEPTNEAYATAKLAGIKLCEAYRRQYGVSFISGIPGDVFGPGDEFDAEAGHVVPALIRRMWEAEQSKDAQIAIWGTGSPRREFLYVDDLARACLCVMEHYDDARPINLGGGTIASIAEVAERIRETVGFRGRLAFDTSRPDGAPFKSLDSTELRALGWSPAHDLSDALRITFRWFRRYHGDR